MRALIAALLLSVVPATALAVFSFNTVPEPGALDLVAIGGVVLVVARLFKRRK